MYLSFLKWLLAYLEHSQNVIILEEKLTKYVCKCYMHPGPKMGEKRKWGGLCEVKS